MVTINCIGGIGDILFCEPIFRYLWQRDDQKPQVVIHDHHLFLQGYIESAIFVQASLVPHIRDCAHASPDYIPLRWANQLRNGYSLNDHHDYENMMLDKYRIVGLGESLWKTLHISFNVERTDSLFKILSLFILDTYLIVNRESRAGTIEINAPKRKHIVEQRSIPGFNVLDWAGIYRQADGIHTVSTCSFFIMQALKNQGWHEPDIFIYPRPNEDGLRGISQLEPDFNYTAQ